MGEPTHLRVVGAWEHNLRGVDLEIPRDALVVFTGVSGSGKSSLAYDTILREGQRRYMESLSAYARQFLGRMERPKVDRVEGVSPTLAVDQKTVNRNPRSTVGTVTEVYDALRLWMARLGTPHCPQCARPVQTVTVDRIVDDVLRVGAGARIRVLAPIVRGRKGEHREVFRDLVLQGWTRALVNGADVDPNEPPELARYEKHDIAVIVDRLRATEGDRGRLAEAVEAAVRLAEGTIEVDGLESPKRWSVRRACADHPSEAIPELEPRLFSFNAPQGACPTCVGLGAVERFHVDALVDPRLPVPDAFRAFGEDGRLAFAHFTRDDLVKVARALGADLRRPVGTWPDDLRARLLHGDPELRWTASVERADRQETRDRPWNGLVGMVETIWKYTQHGPLAAFRTRTPCTACNGERLNPVARSVRFRGRSVVDFARMTVAEAHVAFRDMGLEGAEHLVGAALLRVLVDRLAFLDEVGLGYLGLERSAATLSGGEAQRIRLAAQVGSGLQGVTYVLDEPSIGLHARDNARLLSALRRLRDRGNTVLVVEHDADTILAADWVVDVGPGAGREGGRICASGPPAKVLRERESPTAAWLRGERAMPARPVRRKGRGHLVVRNAKLNNVDGVTVGFPVGALTCVTGVSGSGKSSLVFGVLEPGLRSVLDGRAPGHCDGLDGAAAIDRLVVVSQSPIGRTPRSNPATYTGLMDVVRDLFAATAESRARGYKKGRFSFNVAGGRCEACGGAGCTTIDMEFLPSVDVVCESCNGRRFTEETREVTWRGLSIDRVLDLTVREALAVFSAVPAMARILKVLDEVGLGYLPLGQPSTTLSGGEAQRIKLATELHKPSGRTGLYLLDEPTTGLHFSDVDRLLAALHRLVEAGHTVIVVEHHLDVIRSADHVVDLGPEGGSAGGRVVGEGTPEALAGLSTPTGQALSAAVGVAEPVRRPSRRMGQPNQLSVRGARGHNLDGVDVDLPLGKMTVLAGRSGSGKTSLAFDTIFAEGQRRYVESLSTYARRFLGRTERAPVTSIVGLQPAVAIDVPSASHNPRSTVATVTELHDVLRLLFARVGVPHCPSCERPLRAWTPTEVAGALAPLGTGWLVVDLRPAGEAAEARRDALVADGWTRLWDGAEVDLTESASVGRIANGASLVLDRGRGAGSARWSDAVATGFRLSGAVRFVGRDGVVTSFSEAAICPDHGVAIGGELTPRHFSFNSQVGACERCEGLGEARGIDPARVLVQPKQPFWKALEDKGRSRVGRDPRVRAAIDALLAEAGATDLAVERWPAALWAVLWEGRREPVAVQWQHRWGKTVQQVEERVPWVGLHAVLSANRPLEAWVNVVTCPVCKGARLRPELAAVRVAGHTLPQFLSRTIDAAHADVRTWAFTGGRATIAERPLEELGRRLAILREVGVGYLALDRPASTLSGGEAQRIRLASQLGGGLTGVTYVLDEPTVGLHSADTERLLGTLSAMRDAGNTVIVVEHDLEAIERADHVIELGPGAGRDGGRVIASGSPAKLRANAASPTGRWLAGESSWPQRTPQGAPSQWLRLGGARGHNLRVDTFDVPVGRWTTVTGVSGSGKSSLVMQTLVPALAQRLKMAGDAPLPHDALAVPAGVGGLVVVDQAPLGRSSRSTAATYVGAFDPIRELFAMQPGARARGYAASRFSFNAAGGRCEQCEGRGATLVEMHFLPDVWVTCDACAGRRFMRETLEVRFKDHDIAAVLERTAAEAVDLFRDLPFVRRSLQPLVDVGLGYLKLGQPGHTLSAGEAQRIKLAASLGGRRGPALIAMDEPTTGLHPDDIGPLVGLLDRLVGDGHTIVVIEHHVPFAMASDHVVELGPGGGGEGGRVVAACSPGELAERSTPTGAAFAAWLARRGVAR